MKKPKCTLCRKVGNQKNYTWYRGQLLHTACIAAIKTLYFNADKRVGVYINAMIINDGQATEHFLSRNKDELIKYLSSTLLELPCYIGDKNAVKEYVESLPISQGT